MLVYVRTQDVKLSILMILLSLTEKNSCKWLKKDLYQDI